MFSLFHPRYVKEGRTLLKHARKLLHYKKDRISAAANADLIASMNNLRQAVVERDPAKAARARAELENQFMRHIPAQDSPAWRENCEVFLVAIIIAVGVRTFFLQPFTIPTGSMQPTLNGVIGRNTGAVPPNIFTRVGHFLAFGRVHLDVVAKADEIVADLRERKQFIFFTITDIVCEKNTYRVRAPRDVLKRDFHVDFGSRFTAGTPIVRGFVDTGDHVFVDKVSYNFSGPTRGEVFVFNTQRITMITKPGAPSQFYIKRLAGVPGDILRIASPELFVNGKRAEGAAFERIMSGEDGYRGYVNLPPGGFLGTPQDTVTLSPGEYFALGDNSHNSQDSRYWGTVPARNLMGRGCFVYWPFGAHWGFIR